jgi:hypothetical protein
MILALKISAVLLVGLFTATAARKLLDNHRNRKFEKNQRKYESLKNNCKETQGRNE